MFPARERGATANLAPGGHPGAMGPLELAPTASGKLHNSWRLQVGRSPLARGLGPVVSSAPMEQQTRLARIALRSALAGTALVALLLLAAELGLWMAGAHLHPTPRVNALTVGLALVPLAALAWMVYLWAREPVGPLLGVLVRVLLSCLLLVVAAYSLLTAFFLAYFVG